VHQLYATHSCGHCYKVHLVMSQLGLAYNTTWVNALAGETRDNWFLALNPQGTVPFLRVEGCACIAESNAMLWYLAKGSPLFPVSAHEEALAVQWMIFEQTRLAIPIAAARLATTLQPESRTAQTEQIMAWQASGIDGLSQLDHHLQTRTFMTGDRYTITDIAIYGYTHLAHEGGFDLSAFPAVQHWLERVRQTDGYIDMPMIPAEAA